MAFPTVQARTTFVSSTTNTTTWILNPNSALPAGGSGAANDRLYLFLAIDGNPTVSVDASTPEWTKLDQASNSTVVTGAVFYAELTGTTIPSIQINSTASEQISTVCIHLRPGSGKTLAHIVATSANGSSTNSDPPTLTNNSGAAQDFEVLVSRSGDGTTVATVAPTNYTNLQTATGGGSNGASTNTAERQINIANSGTENPGTFTSASEQWVCYTVGVYEVTTGTTFNQSCLATTTPTNSRVNQTGKPLLSTTTPTKAITRDIAKVLSISTTPVSSIIKAITKGTFQTIAGAGVATLAVSRVTLLALQAITGSNVATLVRSTGKLALASTGSNVAALVRQTGKIASAVTTPVSSLVRSTAKALTAATTPVASRALQTAKILRNNVTATATLTAIRVFLKSCLASTTPVGSVSRATAKIAQAATQPVTVLVRATTKILRVASTLVASLDASLVHVPQVFNVTCQAVSDAIASLASLFTSAPSVWTEVPDASGTWSEQTDASGIWTEVPDATGSWT